jgi:uncharacterized protein (TIGR00251 family)
LGRVAEVAVHIPVRVYPNSARNEVAGLSDGVWRVRISAPPVKGKANKELIAYLSKVMGVGRSSLSVAKGHTSRSKVVVVEGLTREEVTERFSSAGG